MAKPRLFSTKISRLIGLALMVGGFLFVLIYEPTPEQLPPPVNERPAKLLRIESSEKTAARSYSGRVRPTRQVDLAFRVSGPLVQLPLERGKLIEEGALIAQIDPRDFETSAARIQATLEKAQAKLSAMKAGEREEVILRLEGKLAAAKADRDNAKIEMDRRKDLLDKEVVSQSEFDQAELRFDTAHELWKAVEQELAQARKGARQEDLDAQEATIRGLEANLTDAQNALADTTLRAPFKGRIARQFVENFQEVKAGQPIVSLQDVSTVEIVADIPESLVAVIQRRMIEKFTVTFESVPGRVFDAEFVEMETEADPRTQTYAGTVSMPSPEDVNLLKGMPAEVQIHLNLEAMGGRGFPVPVTAIRADETNQPRVWKVAPDGSVTLAPVKIGVMTGGLIMVTEGLVEGDVIVTAGVHSLRPGMKVRPFVVKGQG